MYQLAKKVLRRTPLGKIYRNYQNQKALEEWVSSNKIGPAPHILKQRVVKEYARKYKISTFVETGTFLGEMVFAVKNDFDKIYSIELGQDLFQNAKKRFINQKNITILQGDSGEVIRQVLTQVHEPCLFWLDGHYSAGITAKGSKDTPISNELLHIFSHPFADKHIILIDDARLFTGENDYPTIQGLRESIKSNGNYSFDVEDDIIRICGQN